jgi:hypothetical protein
MKSKNIVLVAAILALITFIGFLSETEPQILFGYSVDIWIYRIAWLLLTVYFSVRYFNARKAEKE